MSDLPGRNDPGSIWATVEVWEAYKRGVLKSRDEMNDQRVADLLATAYMGVPVSAEAIMAAAWGEVADE